MYPEKIDFLSISLVPSHYQVEIVKKLGRNPTGFLEVYATLKTTFSFTLAIRRALSPKGGSRAGRAACGNHSSGAVAGAGSAKAGLPKVTWAREESGFPPAPFHRTVELTPSIAPAKVRCQRPGLQSRQDPGQAVT